MSLLMDALKKAENSKRAGQSGNAAPVPAGPPTIWPKLDMDPRPVVDLDAELGLGAEAKPAPATPVTADMPPAAAARAAPTQRNIELAIEPHPEPAATVDTAAPEAPASTRQATHPQPAPRPSPQLEAANQQAARSVFSAKRGAAVEPSRRPFFAVVTVLLLGGVAAAAYFWMELQSPPAPSMAIRPPSPPATVPSAPAAKPSAAAPATPAVATRPPTPAAPPATPPATTAAPTPPVMAAPERARAAATAPAGGTTPAPAPVAPQEPAVRAPRPVAGAAANAATAQGGAPVATPSNLRISRDRRAPSIDPAVAAGYDALAAGNLDEAREHYSRALAADPASRDALLGLATIALRTGRTENAEALFQKVLESHPRDSYAQAQLATLKSDPANSESRVKNLLSRESDPAGAAALQFTLGSQLAAQGRWAEAQQAFFNAFAADPENPDYCYNLAVSLDQIHQSRPAREHYLRAIDLAARRKAAFDPARARARAEQLAAATR